MKPEDELDFLAPDDIRIKGHRIGIESILFEYLHRQQTVQQIADRFPTLTLAQVQATIAYYEDHKVSATAYLDELLEWGRARREQQRASASPFLERIRRLKASRECSKPVKS